MKNLLSLIIVVFLFTSLAEAQKYHMGQVIKPVPPFEIGDTIPVYGMKLTNSKKLQYYVPGTEGDRYISEDRIQLVPKPYKFWEQIWFEYRGADFKKSGWERENRQILHGDALDYFQHAKSSQLIFEDDLLIDYLYQLVFRIFPENLIKDKASNFSIIVLKSLDANSFAFDNGMIILTTAQIAETNSEKDLIEILANRVANVVLDHNLLNLRQQQRAERRAMMWGNLVTIASTAAMAHSNIKYGTTFEYYDALDLGLSAQFISGAILDNIGAKYTMEQNNDAFDITQRYLSSQFIGEENSPEEYLATISSTISYNAWQEYHLKNYDYSLSLVDKLYKQNLATEEDYLLLSHIFRKTSNTRESNLLALDFLKKAEKLSVSKMTLLDKEAGMLYLRLKDRPNAIASFSRYRNNLIELEKAGNDVSKELKDINHLIYKHRFKEEVLSLGMD
ncbi:hypothetical protein [Anditalea andensis]|uniref:Peptidase M48 domain-containing protein n=1 Tax=Anditalea andensis TaxID=1048983 RepID=A0A074KRD2_9BACT|nr:hypothetical protein [Anditalea andensis]KEO72506.1 hypothetical protein EL17_17360 [Anditalea andensis]